MKIKLDENLPLQIKSGLAAFGHDVHTTYEENLKGSNDSQIWAAAQNEQRFLITQDLDFADIRQFIPERILEYCSFGYIFQGEQI
jgi:predicted nuclease of predicted toxin-antitoxin system